MNYTLTNRHAMARLLSGHVPGEELVLAAPVAAGEIASGDRQPRQDGQLPSRQDSQADERRQLEAVAQRLPATTQRNPLPRELESVRLTLRSGLLAAVRENAKHEDAGLWFFELGRRYLPTPALAEGRGLASERRTLGVALTGPLALGWLEVDRDADFFD